MPQRGPHRPETVVRHSLACGARVQPNMLNMLQSVFAQNAPKFILEWGWGFSSDPAGGAYDAPQTVLPLPGACLGASIGSTATFFLTIKHWATYRV